MGTRFLALQEAGRDSFADEEALSRRRSRSPRRFRASPEADTVFVDDRQSSPQFPQCTGRYEAAHGLLQCLPALILEPEHHDAGVCSVRVATNVRKTQVMSFCVFR
jgi:hypothetical protein